MIKPIKFLIKSSYLIPFGFLIWILPSGLQISNIVTSIIAGIVIAFLIVFWNLFEYEKFNEISEKDFLESNHSVSIENNADNWNQLKDRLNLQLAKIRKITETDSLIEYQIDQKITDSILRIEKDNNEIKLNIKRKYFNFIPDMAENYSILKKLV